MRLRGDGHEISCLWGLPPMIRLSLFARSEPDRELDTRDFVDGAIVIGRGEDADWSLEDPDCLLSRRHCLVSAADGFVTVTDVSSNGVFLDDAGERCERGRPIALREGQTLRLGDYIIVLAQFDQSERTASDGPRVPSASTATTPRIGDDPVTRRSRAAEQGVLLETFCSAAHLDMSTFAGEDPAAIMQRLGGVYREMVIGLADLMSERTAAKADYMPDHTTVGHAGNNPFRWASPQRLAVDLLRHDREGFMTGPDAVRASFGDVRRHLTCVFAGMQTAVLTVLDALSPKAIEGRLRGRSQLLPGYRAAAWTEYSVAYEEIRRDADPSERHASAAFREGYAACLVEFESRSHLRAPAPRSSGDP
jgi:predicted component of type VI protein secretion system